MDSKILSSSHKIQKLIQKQSQVRRITLIKNNKKKVKLERKLRKKVRRLKSKKPDKTQKNRKYRNRMRLKSLRVLP